jgi:hypothetical protein
MRPRLRLLTGLFLAAYLVASVPVLAAIPSPPNSSVDPQLLLCPYDIIPFVVIVRDLSHNPVANSSVQLDFTGCAADPAYPGTIPTNLCPSVVPQMTTLITDASGRVEFHLKAGGTCPGAQTRIFADGILLAQRTVASPDQDGNLVVIGQDAAILVAKEMSGVYDATADLDGDGDTNNDAGDYAVYDAHSGHGCDAITPALPRSWGSLKIRYR